MINNEYPFNTLKECGYSEGTLERCRKSDDLLLSFEVALSMFTTPKERSIIHFHYRDGQSLNEIAENNNVGVHTIYMQKCSALKKIADNDCHNLIAFGISSYIKDIEWKSYETGYNKGFDEGTARGFGKAVRLMKEGFKINENSYKSDEEYTLCTDDIFKARTANALQRRFGDLTLKDLYKISPETLCEIRNFGKTSYADVIQVLEEHGFDVTNHKRFFYEKFPEEKKKNYER